MGTTKHSSLLDAAVKRSYSGLRLPITSGVDECMPPAGALRPGRLARTAQPWPEYGACIASFIYVA